MARYTLSTLSKAIGAQVIGEGDSFVDHLAIDSRLEHPFSSSLFIALKGARNDGHNHQAEMYQKGVRNFLVSKAEENLDEASFLVVEDTLVALQEIAAWHRGQFNIPLIGITGSNGKTIVKEWLNEVLKSRFHIARSPGSWNSQIGVPKSVWQLAESHTLGLFEAGISKPSEMEKLAKVLVPSFGIFTNVGPAHSEGFASEREKAEEKASLFRSCETVLFCSDAPLIEEALKANSIDASRYLTWSRKEPAYLQIIEEQVMNDHCKLRVRVQDQDHDLVLPFVDAASIENAIHCLCTALHFGVPIQELGEKLTHLQALPMRLQVLEGVNGSTLVNDAYSNDLGSLRIALDQLRSVAGTRTKAIVLTDLVESGLEADELYDQVATLLQQAGIERAYLIGKQIGTRVRVGACSSFSSADELLAELDENELKNAAVLIKGARAFKLEKVVKQLQEKNHGTVLEIDLAAIKGNLDTYRNKLNKQTKIMVMLKAFGYGSGAPELSRLLEYEQVDYFGVAYANEGIQLRQEGISTPIMVMNASDVAWETFKRFNLEPTVHELAQLRSYVAHFANEENAPRIHLELDTGMHRLGFDHYDTQELIAYLKENKPIHVASIFTHLAGSESAEHDGYTKEQIELFQQLSKDVVSALGSKPLLHILNSSGISRHAHAQMDMVRLGIGLYGYDLAADKLQPALSLHSTISQIKRIPAGGSVGYDRSYKADSERSIAILPIGYADGLRRSLSNGVGHVWINEQKAPIIGRICMDMCMIDVTGLVCSVGDPAVLFNDRHPLNELAAAMDTIPYEVLSSFSQRIERRYSREA